MKTGLPELTVGAFIISPWKELLLVVSPKWNYLYSIPGGHVRHGESVYEAVVREAYEEVGLEVRPVRVIAVQEVVQPGQFIDSSRHFIFVDIYCKALTSDVRLDGEEVVGYVWTSPRKALSLPLEKYTRRLIQQFLRRSRCINPIFYRKTS